MLILFGLSLFGTPSLAQDYACPPTPEDEMGPFYRPGAAVRARVGSGYIVAGQVLSAGDCRPLAKARIEYWLTNEYGRYSHSHRGTIFSDGAGRYRFETNPPGHYTGRPPHIHLRISAPGHHTLVTQHYPKKGETRAEFDLVLRPSTPD